MTAKHCHPRLLPLAALVLFLAILVPAPNPASAQNTTGCVDTVQVTAPASNLASIVASRSAGTCFFLAAGTYRFHDVVPKDGMKFIGSSTTGVVIDGRGHENAFHGTADRVTISHMTFQDFDSSAGTKRQEQSPIRGTARLWASDRGQLATNWTIESIVSQRNYAAGIFLGDHFTVRNSIFRQNGVTGISGDSFVGGVVEFNTVYANGSNQATGVEVNGGGMKFGQAGTPQHPVLIRNNEVYNNPNIGIWCDIGCQGFHVIDNLIRDHVSRGIMYELSSNLVVRGNTVVRANTWTNYRGDFNAGAITVGEARNAVIENNRIENARAGVVVRQTRRPVAGEGFLANYPTINYVTGDVLVRNNVLVAVGSTGVSTGTSGGGIIDDSNIRFVGNSYDQPSSMSFWWTNGQQLTFAQWQAAGRDGAASGSAPRPATGAEPTSPPATAPTTTAPPAAPTPQPAPTTVPPTNVPPTNAPPRNAPPAPVPSTTVPVATVSGSGSAMVPLRINAGGGALTDERGARWLPDRFYIGGNTASHAAGRNIKNTKDDGLYRNERWGADGYDIPLAPGRYRVLLHHAEVFSGCQVADCRAFSVKVEDEEVLSDVDLFDEVGGYSAMVVETVQTVDDGVLSIRFSSSRQNAQVSGIEILPAPLGPTATTTTPPSPDAQSQTSGSIAGAEAGGDASSPGTTGRPSPAVANDPESSQPEALVDAADTASTPSTTTGTDGGPEVALDAPDADRADPSQPDRADASVPDTGGQSTAEEALVFVDDRSGRSTAPWGWGAAGLAVVALVAPGLVRRRTGMDCP